MTARVTEPGASAVSLLPSLVLLGTMRPALWLGSLGLTIPMLWPSAIQSPL